MFAAAVRDLAAVIPLRWHLVEVFPVLSMSRQRCPGYTQTPRERLTII